MQEDWREARRRRASGCPGGDEAAEFSHPGVDECGRSDPARRRALLRERSDVCAVPAAAVVGEAMVALVLADAMVEKFGGDSLAETRANLETFLGRAGERTRRWE